MYRLFRAAACCCALFSGSSFAETKPLIIVIDQIDNNQMVFSQSVPGEIHPLAAVVGLAAGILVMPGAKVVENHTIATPEPWKITATNYLQKITKPIARQYENHEITTIQQEKIAKEAIDTLIADTTAEKIYIIRNMKTDNVAAPLMALNHHVENDYSYTTLVTRFAVEEIDPTGAEPNIERYTVSSRRTPTKVLRCIPPLSKEETERFQQAYRDDIAKDGYSEEEIEVDSTLDNAHILSLKHRILMARLSVDKIERYNDKDLSCMGSHFSRLAKKLTVLDTQYDADEEDG